LNIYQEKLYNPPFSHIYCEKKIYKRRETQEIINKLKNSNIIMIEHYKDIFCRKNQNNLIQKNSQNLIIAENKGTLVYKGAPVCQNFGNTQFYYTTNIINCLYDCEYCFLQGMYPSSNIVLFVNFEDYKKNIQQMLNENILYLCVSFDTDLLAMENLFGLCRKWISFAKENKNLTIEIRTKSSNFNSISDILPSNNVILAWTLSPNKLQQYYEHKTPDIHKRIEAAAKALKSGWKIRLCLDPLIYTMRYKGYYSDLIEYIFKKISPKDINDISLGAFRMPTDYLKKIRRNRKDSLIINYPFEITNGVYHYGEEKEKEITSFVYNKINEYIDKDKIFIWENADIVNHI